MWHDFIEDERSIRSIYGDAIPLLENILFHELKIVGRANLICFLRFDLARMPQSMPVKWTKNGVNAVQLTMVLISAEIVHCTMTGGDITGHVEVNLFNDLKSAFRLMLMERRYLKFDQDEQPLTRSLAIQNKNWIRLQRDEIKDVVS